MSSRTDWLDADAWMLLTPATMMTVEIVFAVLTLLLMLGALLAQRNARGGWLILAGALPLLVSMLGAYYTNHAYRFLLLFMPVRMMDEHLAKAVDASSANQSLILLIGFGVGLLGLATAIWLIRKNPAIAKVSA